jgi:hypothetical protein
MGTAGSLVGIKRPDNLRSSSAEVKNEWSHSSTILCPFMACTGTFSLLIIIIIALLSNTIINESCIIIIIIIIIIIKPRRNGMGHV